MTDIWEGATALVVGGAGFIGSNLARKLIDSGVLKIHIIDNLLSSERENLPRNDRVVFWEGSIADDAILEKLEDRFDYVFHLATYHGNQSSIYDPLADHTNNLLTTLKLFNTIRSFQRLKRVVYSGAGCAVAKKTSGRARPTRETDPISLEMDSPYSISKIVVSSMLFISTSNTGFRPSGPVSKTCMGPEKFSEPAGGEGRRQRSGAM